MLFEESPTGSVPLQDRLKPKGYLKNKKQPAHLENKVQAAFHTPTTRTPMLSGSLYKQQK